MPKTAVISARIDPELKNNVESVFKELGLTVAQAVTLFYKQVELQRGLPFSIKIPNELTAETIRKSEAGEELHKVNSVDELFKELES